jgi:hypothetical protein
MEGATLENVLRELRKYNDHAAAMERRIRELETTKKPEDGAVAASLAATPKTKTALEEEEAEIQKGMAKMMANNASWPVPSVAGATAFRDMAEGLFANMGKKAQTKPPEIEALTGLLELEGDLTQFLSAIAEGTFGNEDVRAMVANGLKSYITAYIGKKIVESEGELMKVVAKNDMPGTATMILGKVKDQIATARTPKAPKSPAGTYKTLSQKLNEKKATPAPAAPAVHATPVHAAPAPVKGTVVPKNGDLVQGTPLTGQKVNATPVATPVHGEVHAVEATPVHGEVHAVEARPVEAAFTPTKVQELQAKKQQTVQMKAENKALNKEGIAEHRADLDLKHETLKQNSLAKNREIDNRINKDKYWFKGTRKLAAKTFTRDASKLRDSRRKRAVTRAPGKAFNALRPSSIRKGLNNQYAAYKDKTKSARETLGKAATVVGEVLSKTAKEASMLATAKRQREKMVEDAGKLERELATATEELDRLRAEKTSPLVEVSRRSKEQEVAQLTKLLAQKKTEVMQMRFGP